MNRQTLTTSQLRWARGLNRREVLAVTAGTILAVSSFQYVYGVERDRFASKRPPVDQRCFISPAIEEAIRVIRADIADAELAWMFENCFPNTLDTTVDFENTAEGPDTFVITGDIDAMWLRDSTAQVWPYLPYLQDDDTLRLMVAGLILRQAKCILLDPYANAFYKDAARPSEWQSDRPSPTPGVHERKWEIDTLCYPIRLTNEYLHQTGDESVLDDDWQRAMKHVVKTFRTEQRKDGTTPYRFVRKTSAMIDAPPFDGTSRPIKPVGLIVSAFRPSDDSTLFPFLIPSNLFAVQSLRQLAEIFANRLQDQEFAKECTDLANEVQAAVEKYAIVRHPVCGEIYAYEVDGFGNAYFSDDANVPSLMSLAYLGIHSSNDQIYQQTRKFLLSENNPYFLRGKVAEGQSSPHTGKERIWPMGIILRAMTSNSDAEISNCLKMLKQTHAGSGFMHESFDKDEPTQYSRDWFAWANTLFGELIVKIHRERPHLLSQPL